MSGAGVLDLAGVDDARDALRRGGYLADEIIATTVFIASRLGRPLLAEGPAGTGKTALAEALAEATGRPLIRLQCYEGLDESKVLYEWNYRKQLLVLQAREGPKEEDIDDIFSEPYLLTRPVLEAIRSPEPVVLLIDELDRIEMETEALLLEVLSDLSVTIPELGRVRATSTPFIVLTSNATREVSEALKRRCLYLWLDYPPPDREREILLAKVPGVEAELADRVVEMVGGIRRMGLKKAPSVAEAIDWATTLVTMGLRPDDRRALENTLGTLLKHHADLERVAAELATGNA